MITEGELEIVEKGWGHEEIIVNNDEYCGKLLKFKAGKKCSLHLHMQKHETFYVLEGSGYLAAPTPDDHFAIQLNPGTILQIPQLSLHQVIATTDMTIIEFSTTHYDDDSYRIIKGD